MENTTITFEVAKLAKKHGFKQLYVHGYPSVSTGYTKEGVLTFITDSHLLYIAPDQHILQGWLRDKHNIDVWVKPFDTVRGTEYLGYVNFTANRETGRNYKTYAEYEDAFEHSLKCAFELLKK